MGVTEQAMSTIEKNYSNCNEELKHVQQVLINKETQNSYIKSHCIFLITTLKNAYDIIEDQNRNGNVLGKDKTTSKKKKYGVNNFNNTISQLHDKLLDLEQQLLKTNNESKNNDKQSKDDNKAM